MQSTDTIAVPNEGKVQCRECGAELKRITNTHLDICCGLTMREYKEKYPDAPIESKTLAFSRVNHLRGKTYEEVYGSEKANELKQKRSMSANCDWAENPVRLSIKEQAEECAQWAGIVKQIMPHHLADPSKYGISVCQNCGVEFEFYTGDSDGLFCSSKCWIQYRQKNSSQYRIKAFANLPNKCDLCGSSDDDLVVHHRDKNRLNDSIENLQILCAKCHNGVHREEQTAYRGRVSLPAIERGMEHILRGLRVSVTDENFIDTPKRVARAYAEIFEGLQPEAKEEIEKQLSVSFPYEGEPSLIVFRDIVCWSMCPHHFLPVKYTVHIGYLPNDRVLGASKLPRLAVLLAKRPSLQEDFTQDIVNYIEKIVQPQGAIVTVIGEHQCMQMRGVKSVGSSMTTAGVTGVFKHNEGGIKDEFYELLKI